MKVKVFDRARNEWIHQIYEYVTTIPVTDKKGNVKFQNILLSEHGYFMVKDMKLCRRLNEQILEDTPYILPDN